MIELMNHNIPTYKALCELLENHNRVALVQATGTGKSYIAGKYIEEHDYKTAIIVPSLAIGKQWNSLTNADIYTYQTVSRRNEFVDWLGNKGYELVICDEMHHLGADKWGKFFRNLSCKVLGLTATEIRYLDGSRNMVSEFFDGNVVYGVNLADAINQGILPSFKYVSVLYKPDFKKYKELIKQGETKEKRDKASHRLEHCIENYVSIEQALSENLTPEAHHIICFFNNIDELETVKENVASLFPDYEVFNVHSKKSKNDDEITAFKDSRKAIMFCVNMLNEGVHVDGVDTVIFFRTTESPILYFQQLGRCLDSKGCENRVVFDFVCNSERIHGRMQSVKREERKDDFVEKINKDIQVEKRIIYKNYTKDLSTLWDEINSNVFSGRTDTQFKSKDWSADEDMKLMSQFDFIFNPIISQEQIREVSEKAKELGYQYPRVIKDRVIKLHSIIKNLEILEYRENANLNTLNLTNKELKEALSDIKLGFTTYEIEVIKNNNNGNLFKIADYLERNIYSVFLFCKESNIIINYSPRQEIGKYTSDGQLLKTYRRYSDDLDRGLRWTQIDKVLDGKWSNYYGYEWDFTYRRPDAPVFEKPDNTKKIVFTFIKNSKVHYDVFNSYDEALNELLDQTDQRESIERILPKILSGEMSQRYLSNIFLNAESIEYLEDKEKELKDKRAELLKQLEDLDNAKSKFINT